MQASTCNVKFCRFPSSHITLGHRCGICRRYGHGQLECGKQDLINYSVKVLIKKK